MTTVESVRHSHMRSPWPSRGRRESTHDAIDGEVEDVEAAQAAARRPFGIGRVERIVQDERDMAFGDAAVGAQGMAAEGREVVRGGGRSDAGLAIADDHDVALAVDGQIEQAGGGYLVMDGFD